MVDWKISQIGQKLFPLSMVSTSLNSSSHLLGAWPCDLLCVLVYVRICIQIAHIINVFVQKEPRTGTADTLEIFKGQ